MSIQPLPRVRPRPGERRASVYVEFDNYGSRYWERVLVPKRDVSDFCRAVERAGNRSLDNPLAYDTILTGNWRTTVPRIVVTPSAPPRRRRRGSTPRAGPRPRGRGGKER